MDEETPMEPEKNNDAKDKPPVLKDEAIALAKAGDLPGALAAANAIEDTEERAAALEAIATATAEKEPEKVPPASYVKRRRENANTGVGIGVFLQVIGFLRWARMLPIIFVIIFTLITIRRVLKVINLTHPHKGKGFEQKPYQVAGFFVCGDVVRFEL